MKHIKKIKLYKEPSFNVGDYVVLDDLERYMWTIYLIVKITKVERTFESIMPYTFLAIQKDEKPWKSTGDLYEIAHMEEHVIKRLATSEEIEWFDMNMDAKKYNL